MTKKMSDRMILDRKIKTASRQIPTISGQFAANIMHRYGSPGVYEQQTSLVMKDEASWNKVYLEAILELLAQVKSMGNKGVPLSFYQQMNHYSKAILHVSNYISLESNLSNVLRQLSETSSLQDPAFVERATASITKALAGASAKKKRLNLS